MPCHAAQVRLRTATGLAYTPTDCQLIWQAEGGGTIRPTPKAPAANSALQSVPRPIKRAINEMLHTTTRLWHSSFIELSTDPGERQSRKLGGAGRTLQVAVKRQTFRSPGEFLLYEDDLPDWGSAGLPDLLECCISWGMTSKPLGRFVAFLVALPKNAIACGTEDRLSVDEVKMLF